MRKERMIEFDLLRIIALFSVMVLHTACYKYGTENYIINTYIKLNNWGVPVFLMLTGMLFLDNNRFYSIEEMFTKYIKRLFIAYIFWSFLYSLYNTMVYGGTNKTFILGIINGDFHLWYLVMCIGIYMVIPIIKTKIKNINRYLLGYIITLSMIGSFIVPIVGKIDILNSLVGTLIENMHYSFLTGYIVFVLLGFYLKHYNISDLKRKVLYVITIISIVICIYGEKFNVKIIQICISYFASFSIVSLLIAVTLFCITKYNIKIINFSKKSKKLIMYVSEHVFTMYLVHEFINRIFVKIGYTVNIFNPIFSVPIVSLTVFISSFIISIVINFLYKNIKYIFYNNLLRRRKENV